MPYLHPQLYKIKIPKKFKEASNPKHKLDIYILEKYVLNDILGIEDSRTSKQISFVPGEISDEDLIRPVLENNMAAVFTLYPVEAHDIFAVSDAEETMPPKSTWIEPKMRSGLLIHVLKD